MFQWIDGILNKITMYRLVLYVVAFLLCAAFVLSAFGFLPFGPVPLLFSSLFFVAVCWLAHKACVRFFCAPANVESIYITALILALIISPPSSPFDLNYFSLAIWASIWAMASKYIFAIRMKHIFNPAAFAIALTALTLNQSASWWVGTAVMLPFVFVSGALIVKKIRRFDMVAVFFAVALISIVGAGIARSADVYSLVTRALIETPIFFFAFVMFTEPLTAPQAKHERLWYAALVGFLIAPWVHIGTLYSTPELALVVGNLFAYLVSPKEKLMLHLKKRTPIADNTFDFVFKTDRPVSYKPGQYMEWTLAHDQPDNRGNRRYFTLASSPTEKELCLGVKFYPKGSTFKNALMNMSPTDIIAAAQLAGDFVLPRDPAQKIVFIAGGIGVTPFRSMIKYLIDQHEPREIALFYANNTAKDIAYADVFEQARKELGIKTVYTLADPKSVPPDWKGSVGFVDDKMIAKEVPDFAECVFYLSGPHVAVVAFERALKKLGIHSSKIKKDFFPGFA